MQLPYRVRWQDLKDLFRRAGTVLRADVSLGPDNRSRGYGNVVLATAEDAGRAIDMFNGYCWQTRVLEVRPDRFGASVDDFASLANGGTNGHLPSATNSYDEIAPGHDLGGSGAGTKSLFVGNVSSLSIVAVPLLLGRFVHYEFLLCVYRLTPLTRNLYAYLSSPSASFPHSMAGFEGPISYRGYCFSGRCCPWPRWALPRVWNRQFCHGRWC